MGKKFEKKNSSKGYANYKRNGREAPKAQSFKRCDMDKLTSNDIAYYNKDKTLFDQVTRVPWDKFMGDFIDTDALLSVDPEYRDSFSGIMRVDYIHGPGFAKDRSDAVNRAVTRIMSEVYAQTNASSLPYTQADLAMWITSTSSIAMNIALCKRALSAVNFWVTRNLYYPRALIKSMGLDFEDLKNRRDEYTSTLNILINDFNTMKVPHIVDVYDRQYSLAHNIYVDEDSVLGQVFYFMPDGYYTYVDTESGCKWETLPNVIGSNTRLSTWLGIIDKQLQAWRHSQVLYYMMGSMLRTFKGNEFYSISQSAVTDSINPITDEVMSMQVMNCTIWDYNDFDTTSLNITQDVVEDTLTWIPKTKRLEARRLAEYVTDSVMLRAFKDQVSADDIMEMTRLTNKPVYRPVEDDAALAWLEFTECTPEIVCNVHEIRYRRDTDTIEFSTLSHSILTEYHNDTTSLYRLIEDVKICGKISNFRYIPTIWMVVYANPNEVEPETVNILGDIYNYTTLSQSDLESLHRCAAYSLYTVKIGQISINA